MLYRKPLISFYSIEEVFKIIKNTLEGEVDFEEVYLPYDSNGLINKVRNIWFIKNLKCELLHITGEVYYSVLLYKGPFILTIHDIAEIFKGSILRKFLIKLFWYQLPANRSKAIAIVSDKSKNEFTSNIRVDYSKIRVINNPKAYDLSVRLNASKNKKFTILQVGTKMNKNFDSLIEAVKGLDVHILIIGYINKEVQQELEISNISYSNFIGLSRVDLLKMYEKSDLLAFISTYEGFGVPIIEAQAIGCPVITSNVTSMPEVAGEGALLVDPFNVEEIRKGILRIINEAELREDLIQKGLENVKRFDPKKIANQYLEVYKEAFGEA